jgi:hypothetical protein
MREYCFFQRSYKNAKIISTDFLHSRGESGKIPKSRGP